MVQCLSGVKAMNDGGLSQCVGSAKTVGWWCEDNAVGTSV